jgi:hypothetical protein
VLARRQLRARLLGESPLAYALAPLLPLALLAALDGVGGASSESDPAQSVTSFIEDVSFGVPDLPDDYVERPLRRREGEQLLAPLLDVAGTLSLTGAQAQRINGIQQQLAMFPPRVQVGREYGMAEIVDLLKVPLNNYYPLGQWRGLALWWGERLGAASGPEAQRAATLQFMLEELPAGFRLPEMMVRIFLAAAAGSPSLAPGPDCLEPGSGVEGIGYSRVGRYHELRIEGVGIYLTPNQGGRDALLESNKFVELLRRACTQTLAAAFTRATEIFSAEQEQTRSYVQAWWEILEAWQQRRAALQVRISNLSRYDMFVRREARIGIGGESGGPAAVEITAPVGPLGERGGDHRGEHFLVKRRAASAVRIEFELPDEALPLRDASSSEVRVALRVSSLDAEGVVLSPPAPFSSNARARERREIDYVHIEFPDASDGAPAQR